MSAAASPVVDNKDSLAHGLRRHGLDIVEGQSSLSSCLMPLLEALNWRGDLYDVAEALPHFADDIDLIDLRNAFVTLGYESHPHEVTIQDIDDRLMPCLFVSADSQSIVPIIGRDAQGLIVWRNGDFVRLNDEDEGQHGTAFYFTRISQDRSQPDPHVLGWFGKTLRRFKSVALTLLGISFFTNLFAVMFPLFIMFVYDRIIGGQTTDGLGAVLIGVLTVLGVDLLLRFLRARILGFIAGRLDYLLGIGTFDKIFGLPPAFTERAAVSSQLSRIREFESLRDFFTGPLASAAIEMPFVVLMITVVALIAGPVALVPLFTVFAFVLFGLVWLPTARQLTVESGKVSTEKEDLLVETLLNVRTIKELGAEDVWRDRYRLASAKAISSKRKSEVNSAVLDAVSHGLMMLSGIIILGLGTIGVLDGWLTIGALIASMILSWRILSPIQTAFLAYTKIDQIKRSLGQLNNLMMLQPEGNDGKSRLLFKNYDGDVVLNRVSFRYTADLDPALLGVSLKVAKNQMVTLMGPSGAGKSSILKLIAGLYMPQGGSVTIAGLDLRQVDPRDLRRKIAYVPQRPDIFYGTIAQNLRMANPIATDENLRTATQQAGLLDLIEALPDGFQTRVGLGQNEDVAPGFMQRLSIARALVRDAAILLLDEPAQALDFAGDAALVELLKSLKGERTIIMVSHRPSHIRLSDSTVLLNRGVVEFEGAPDQALSLAKVFNGG